MQQTLTLLTALLLASLSVLHSAEPKAFPYMLPDKKPDQSLSAAMSRLYDEYFTPTPGREQRFQVAARHAKGFREPYGPVC